MHDSRKKFISRHRRLGNSDMTLKHKHRILFASSSVGLGHISRDVYLASLMDYANIEWVTAGTALRYLETKNVSIHPVSYELKSIGEYVGGLFKEGRLKATLGEVREIYSAIKENSEKVKEHVNFDSYECVVADEFWEFLLINGNIEVPTAFITDFTRFRPPGHKPWLRVPYWLLNREIRKRMESFKLKVYVGFSGNTNEGFVYRGIIPTHGRTGEYGEEDYILVNIGGTNAGEYVSKLILDSIGPAYRVIVIGGSKHFDPDPLGKIARAKLVITLGGYSSLVELMMYQKRGIIVPLAGHFEQEDNARAFLGREGYRVIKLDELKRVNLKKVVDELLNEEADPPNVKDGAPLIVKDIHSLIRN